MKKIFTKHPHSMGETYCKHWRCSLKFGSQMVIGGIACLIHSFLPFLFQKTGSNFLFSMVKDYIHRAPATDERIIELAQQVGRKVKS